MFIRLKFILADVLIFRGYCKKNSKYYIESLNDKQIHCIQLYVNAGVLNSWKNKNSSFVIVMGRSSKLKWNIISGFGIHAGPYQKVVPWIRVTQHNH
ncbi:hypothetical protein QTP88_005081 [Uroleucon formosanum]